MSDLAPTREPRRLGLWIPFVLIVALIAGWSAYWFYTAHRIDGLITLRQSELIKAGYQVSYEPLKVRGYPYRMFAEFKNLTVIAPSGRGFATPLLNAEANAYALDKWVMNAPSGLTLYRGHPAGQELGKVVVTGQNLRASVSGLNNPVYNVALQGLDLTLTPSDLAHPFAFSAAENFEAYLRPTRDTSKILVPDSADMLIRLTGAHGQPGSTVANLSPEKPLSLHVEGTVDHISGFAGKDFGDSLKAWSAGGGLISGFKSSLKAGDLDLFASSDDLRLDASSRLSGHMDVELSGAFKPMEVLSAVHLISKENMTLAAPLLNMTLATQGPQKFPIDFKNGSAYIGALKVSDAPILP